MVGRARLRRQPVQHRHLARRPPDRLHVEGDHPRRRARERLLAERHRRRHEPVHACPASTAQAHERRTPAAGTDDLWAATAGSVNCAFVRLATSVGQDKVIAMAHKMGITKQQPPAHPHPHARDLRAEHRDMATVMATIANGGVHHTPVRRAEGRRRPTAPSLFDQSNEPRRPGARPATSPRASRTCCAASSPAAPAPTPTSTATTVFGKTGTTDDRADAWFIGATPQLATAVWFGNRRSQRARRRLRWRLVGARSSSAFMSQALDGQPDLAAARPRARCARGRRQTVNPHGGHGGARPAQHRRPRPQLPTVQQQPDHPRRRQRPRRPRRRRPRRPPPRRRPPPPPRITGQMSAASSNSSSRSRSTTARSTVSSTVTRRFPNARPSARAEADTAALDARIATVTRRARRDRPRGAAPRRRGALAGGEGHRGRGQDVLGRDQLAA